MQIKSLFVDNFRGMDKFSMSDFDTNMLIIGKNDAGKTNICTAIRKVLDLDFRRIPFDEADSTNSNKMDIFIKIILSVDDISQENRSLLGPAIDRDNTITVEYVGKFDDNTQLYGETLFLGSDDPKDYPTNKTTPIDKVLDVIYIDPIFNLYEDKNQFFRFRSAEDKENENAISDQVASEIETLNHIISEEANIKTINNKINEMTASCLFFEGMKFKTESNINPTNIYRSLDIVPYDDKSVRYNNIGDGKNKTLSFLLKNMSKKTTKEKILIVEEPENHLYPQYQRQFSKLIDSLHPSQAIVTTHSPSIIDFRKTRRIIKLSRANGHVACAALNTAGFSAYNQYGFLANEDFAQMLFFDEILLVEGFSERYFYNRLMVDDESFLDYCSKHNFGVFAVDGIAFEPYRQLLSSLNIKVFIKTDNDLFPVPKTGKKILQYAGLKRVVHCMDDSGQKELLSLLKWTDFTEENFQTKIGEGTIPIIEEESSQISELLKKYGIYFSRHHQGFEKDFLDFVDKDNADNFAFLCESKLKNLHAFIQENNIGLRIVDKNKTSVLVDFMNV